MKEHKIKVRLTLIPPHRTVDRNFRNQCISMFRSNRTPTNKKKRYTNTPYTYSYICIHTRAKNKREQNKNRGDYSLHSSSNFSPVSFGRRTEILVHHIQTRQSFRATLRINLATAKNLAGPKPYPVGEEKPGNEKKKRIRGITINAWPGGVADSGCRERVANGSTDNSERQTKMTEETPLVYPFLAATHGIPYSYDNILSRCIRRSNSARWYGRH